MNEETLQLCKEIRGIIAKAGDYSGVSPHDVFLDAEALVSSLAFLISAKLTLEGTYRREIVKHLDNGLSHAESEARAKSGDAYIQWKKIEALYKLAEQQIMLCKKFKDDLEAEFKRA